MNWKKSLAFLSFALFFLMADAWLKAYVHYDVSPLHASLPVYPFGGIGVLRDWHGIDFSIVHVSNKGAAWGMFSSIQEYLLYARVAIIGGLLTFLLFVKNSPYRKFCFTLIATGALGNVIDYFVYGHVVDMFYFIFWGYSYPVFNIADSLIFVGIMLLFAEAMIAKLRSPKKSPARKTA